MSSCNVTGVRADVVAVLVLVQCVKKGLKGRKLKVDATKYRDPEDVEYFIEFLEKCETDLNFHLEAFQNKLSAIKTDRLTRAEVEKVMKEIENERAQFARLDEKARKEKMKTYHAKLEELETRKSDLKTLNQMVQKLRTEVEKLEKDAKDTQTLDQELDARVKQSQQLLSEVNSNTNALASQENSYWEQGFCMRPRNLFP